ncbi:beta-galactosidase-1-like protein 2 [Clavelina lepadiformis]|uniref:beta-galactosidase-1-like protein 2 n=1 Tax=Clavelina lepadiformis TaxID=159417 RepID=UPI0040427055
MRRQHTFYCIAGSMTVYVVWMLLQWHGQISSYENELENPVVRLKNIKRAAYKRGLLADEKSFILDGKPFVVLSGAVHYFRMPQEYWRDRLLKMKACGLNTIETYVPWNLHEPEPGRFNFDNNLSLTNFLSLAQELKLLVFLRPGPYICSEWEFGGLPSWLLRDPVMKVRTTYPPYTKAVVRYFDKLLPMVKPHQYKQGGSIVAFQLDNEYGAYFHDKDYVPFLKKQMERHGIDELLFTSDNSEGIFKQTLPGVLKTVNFKHVDNHFKDLKRNQPNAPLMVMEFWTGWFDWWGEKHHTMSVQEFSETLNEILSVGASVNFYMFYGGTNFGFMNGGYHDGHVYKSDITSYDYDALIAENGDLTPKYHKAKKIISQYYPNAISNVQYSFPEKYSRKAYSPVEISTTVTLWDSLQLIQSIKTEKPVTMEMLDINNGAGQSYGYTMYRSEIDFPDDRNILIGGLDKVQDRGYLFVNQEKATKIDDSTKSNRYEIVYKTGQEKRIQIDVLVENGGRINWARFNDQRKGLTGALTANENMVQGWTTFPLEMKPDFIGKLSLSDLWKQNECKTKLGSPTFFKVSLSIDGDPTDTYIDMRNWGKGVVFINNKNLGRYWNIGPQMALYIPAPWLKKDNEVIIFEEIKCSNIVSFCSDPLLG